MRQEALDKVREYVLNAENPISPVMLAADLLNMHADDVRLAYYHLQREGLLTKKKVDESPWPKWMRAGGE